MAPSASEPRQLLVVLDPDRRRALYSLVRDITAHMRAQLQLDRPDGPGPSIRDEGTSGPVGGSTTADAGRPASERVAPPSAELVRLRVAALEHLDAWRKDVLSRLREVLKAPDDQKILDERRARADRLGAGEGEDLLPDLDTPTNPTNIASASESCSDALPPADSVAALQRSYRPVPTPLAALPARDRAEALCAVVLLLLASGNYSADSRTLALHLASSLELPPRVLAREETEIARSLVESSTSQEAAAAAAASSMSADAEKRKQENQTKRYWKVGLASVAGAAIIGVTGGLAAPVVAGAIGGIMGSVGLGGVASFLGIFWMNGALVGTLFGAFGARMTGEMVDQYAREVQDFRFLPLRDEQESGGEEAENKGPKDKGANDKDKVLSKEAERHEAEQKAAQDKEARRLRVTIGINGWLASKDDVTKPWRVLGGDAEAFALRYEMERLLALGASLEGLVGSYAWSAVKLEILKRTVLSSLGTVLWPAYLLNTASYVDNPFGLARNRSDKAGRVLADALIARVQGERPVALVGYSLGARVVYACLRSLAERRAFGLVDTAVFVGAPVPSDRTAWQVMRSVVSGRLCNVYSRNDYVLAFLYRAASAQLGVAGLGAIKGIPGVENLDLSAEVHGHLRYPDILGKILLRCGFSDVGVADGPIEKDEDETVGLESVDGVATKAGEQDNVAPPPLPTRPKGPSGGSAGPPTPDHPPPPYTREEAPHSGPGSPKSAEPENVKYIGSARDLAPRNAADADRDDDFTDMVTYTEPLPVED